MLFVYLLVCRNSSILAHVYFRFLKVNFPFTKGGGGGGSVENCHIRLRSTTSGTHFDPHDTHSLCHMTQRMSYKRPYNFESPLLTFGIQGKEVLGLQG